MPALNCGFGPKDIRDLTWDHINEQRITLPGSKTGVCQVYLLWLETCMLSEEIQQQIAAAILRMVKRRGQPGDNGHAFMTRFWKSWNKDAVAEQFCKLCKSPILRFLPPSPLCFHRNVTCCYSSHPQEVYRARRS
jgi:hypothetical protein